MEPWVARRLNRLDEEFYRAQAASFSATRQAPWQGWERCLRHVPGRSPLRVLDVAAGNLRLARYLAEVRPGTEVAYRACDSCPGLLPGWQPPAGWQVSLERRDVVGELLDASHLTPSHTTPDPVWGRASFDLVACFGFLHHVPTFGARVRLLRQLVGATAPDGVCCVSLWRFMESPRLARQALDMTPRALAELDLGAGDLDAGDYLLGWQGRPHAYRYCHSFSDDEASALLAAVSDVATPRDRFAADGPSGRLNGYLVLGPR